MNKEIERTDLINHSVSIIERQNISINGITKIDSFDSEDFLLETTVGPLEIKGRELEIVKLDTYEGTIVIKGALDQFAYLENSGSKKEAGILARLFK